MKHLFRLYSAAILTLALILCSCSGFMNGQTCSVSFQFDGEEMGKIIKGSGMSRQGDGSGMYMQVSLLGVYNASQTAIFADEMTFEFDDVPVGIPVRAYAKIYVTESGEASVTEHIRYSGESEEIVVESGENYLKVILGPPHTVQFQTATGAAFDSQTVEYGKTVAKPSDPTSTGIFFAGWYKDSGYTNRFDFSEPITQDLTLYAKWVATLEKPVIKYYTDATYAAQINSTNDNQDPDPKYKAYSNYNVNVDNSGNANLYYKVYWPDGTEIPSGVTVSINCQKPETTSNIGSSGSLNLGPCVLKIQVSKTGCATQEFEGEKVYVQGILSEPSLSSTNGGVKLEISGSGSSMSDPEKWQFSYLDYDVMECYINPGNGENNITLYSGSDVLNEDGFDLAPDKTHYLRIVQTRNYCKPLETKKYVNVTIRPIKLTYHNTASGQLKGDARICLGGIGRQSFDLIGQVLINGFSIWYYQAARYSVTADIWDTLDRDTDSITYEETFTTTNDTITMAISDLKRRNIASSGEVFISGTEIIEKKLSEIKNVTIPTISLDGSDTLQPPVYSSEGWILYFDRQSNQGAYVYLYVKFEASDD